MIAAGFFELPTGLIAFLETHEEKRRHGKNCANNENCRHGPIPLPATCMGR